MKDYTDANISDSLDNGDVAAIKQQTEAGKAIAEHKGVQADILEQDTKLRKAKRENDEEKFKGKRSKLKRVLVGLGIGSALVGGSVVTYQVGKGVKESVVRHPDVVQKAAENITDGVLETAEAAGTTVKATGETVNTTINRVNEFISRPDWEAFLKRIENTSGRFGTRTLQAQSWTRNHPETPVTKEQLESVLQARKDYKEKHDGKAMPPEESAKVCQKICGWKKKISSRSVKERE